MFSRLPPQFVQIWGCNTDVGKTVFSAALVRAALDMGLRQTAFVKPIQTGYPIDSDARWVNAFSPEAYTATLFKYRNPASPHLTAIEENRPVSDHTLLSATRAHLASLTTANISSSTTTTTLSKPTSDYMDLIFVETAGGVNSPTMSGSLQCDAFRPLRLPSILIGDSKLGGISTTLSAYESLRIRGYDISHVLLFDDPDRCNHTVIERNVRSDRVIVHVIPLPPPRPLLPDGGATTLSKDEDMANMSQYICSPGKGTTNQVMRQVVSELRSGHETRLHRLEQLKDHGANKVWWPFTQHQNVKHTTVIDSAYGDCFTVYNSGGTPTSTATSSVAATAAATAPTSTSFLKDQVDACASWWTNGLGHGNVHLSKAAAYAAGRYGHVMFPECIHEPAYTLSTLLLDTAGKGWADRVFYSDNGSTAVEVAVKMALSKTEADWNAANLTLSCSEGGGGVDSGGKGHNSDVVWNVIGLHGSYHGDTIGAMDLSSPNVYNKQVHWYNGKGLWFDPPTLLMRKGRYSIQSPSWLHPFLDNNQNLGENASFQSFSDALDPERRASGVAKAYRKHIITTLSQFIASSNQQQQPQRLGALILEPIIQGAGGMMLIDPLFQVELVDIVRNPGLWHPKVKSTTSNEVIVPPPLPVVFDEVFVGMYRLGDKLPSAAQMLQRLSASSNLKPDIACYAKSLTGGLLPLAVTLASSSVFDVFLSSEKQAALLHGHSYTAHPIGCSVAVRSLETYLEKAARKEEESDSVWPREKLEVLSSHDKVAGLVAIGRVLAVTLQDNRGGGYVSTGASGKIVAKLRNEFNIFARPLGPVVYLMVRQNADAEVIRSLADSLIISIDECFK